MPIRHRSSLTLALIAAGIAFCNSAYAVRVNADGHGQALIYPYYTARSAASGNAYVTAMSVTNITSKPKALKVRFLEGKTGAEVFDLDLFLAAHDVWTAGVVAAGAGAGIFTSDHSCTLPQVSNSAAAPTKFRNGAYVGDLLGDSLDRTYEGYLEVLEMGVIDPASALGLSVTHAPDHSAPNASRPSCIELPATDTVPAGLSRPTGGLMGGASYINVNDGTDYSIDAVALSQWSDQVQWSAAGNPHPNLADASPPISYVVEAREDGDLAFVTNWSSGRDTVSALFMADRVRNDYSVEPAIRAGTDWVVTMPTKRFHVSATAVSNPFQNELTAIGSCDEIGDYAGCGDYPYMPRYLDREGLETGFICFLPTALPFTTQGFCGTANVVGWAGNAGRPNASGVFGATNALFNMALVSGWVNGYGELAFSLHAPSSIVPAPHEAHHLTSPEKSTLVIDLVTGAVAPDKTVTYFGLPIVGFAIESYSNGSVKVGQSTVLSTYGAQFNHKIARRIEVAP